MVPVGNPPIVPCSERNKDVWTSADTCEKCGTTLGEKKEGSYTRNHPDAGMVHGRLMFAKVGQTKTGKPKFFSTEKATEGDKIIVVFLTKMGFRGGNSHTGDRAGWECAVCRCDASGDGVNIPEICSKCGATGNFNAPRIKFAEFPCQILCRGVIAEGAAGRMGSGEQLIAIVPKDVVFRTSYLGRLYGAPGSHYYKWDGSKLLAATWDERATADLF